MSLWKNAQMLGITLHTRPRVIEGTFSLSDLPPRIAEARIDALSTPRWYKETPNTARIDVSATTLESRNSEIKDTLTREGCVQIQLDRALSNREYIRFGELFGTFVEEDSPHAFIEDTHVVNIRQDFAATANAEFQPFAENFITFHVERSYQPYSQRPRYIFLLCISAPNPDRGGQTVLMSTEDVLAHLSERAKAILSETYYSTPRSNDNPSNPIDALSPFVYSLSERTTVCFRDFDLQVLRWRHTGHAKYEEVKDALVELYSALYNADNISGIRWRPNQIAVIDNTRYLHGKTYCDNSSLLGPRWLKRIMVR